MSGTRRFERAVSRRRRSPSTGRPSSARRSSRSWCTSGGASSRRLTIVFLVGSIGYLLLAAFVPGVMGWQIADGLPFAWIAAMSQVLLTWVLTWAYLRKADRDFEPLEQRAAALAERGRREAAR